MKGELSVTAVPADEQRGIDPYNYILNASLKAQGVTIHNYSRKRITSPSKFDVLHLHKPEMFLGGKSVLEAYKNFLFLFFKIVWAKARGKKIVWTVHKLFNLKAKHPSLAKLLYSLLFKYTDGYITLTKHGANQLTKLGVPVEKIVVIPHPHCIGYYPNNVSKTEARHTLGIPADKFVFLFAGNIRGHKNLAGLIKAFRQMKDNNAVLVIAGKIHSTLSDELGECAKDRENIFVFPQFIEDEDLQLFFNCADLVVLPYQKTAGFGTTFLNLSFSKPTLVSKTEIFLELQQQVGADWIKTFSGPLTAAHLKKSKAEVEQMDEEKKPNLSVFDWNKVAETTKAFYFEVIAGKRSQAGKMIQEKKESLAQPVKSKILTSLQVHN